MNIMYGVSYKGVIKDVIGKSIKNISDYRSLLWVVDELYYGYQGFSQASGRPGKSWPQVCLWTWSETWCNYDHNHI